ncbi:cell death protein 6-like isoform X1 [Mytilus californianus]|uniref:cell death protein 6-like isoform X1 n=2 Tax=Mytilus californianus TaxID=6549 RepID=UPI00224576EC|nr:cell death protein 6-like isoform X1 [Mytilus californianus]
MMVLTHREDQDEILPVPEEKTTKLRNRLASINRNFGSRKFIHVGLGAKSHSTGLLNVSRLSEDDNTADTEYTGTPEENMRAANKQWVHPPDALTRGHIVYNVKFLGETEVDQPKGTEVVRDSIRKRKFNKHIKKAEGQKTPKVELTISVDGVTIQDPKTKMTHHSYPLHRISYCADDKTDKRMFTFIAKSADSNKHYCYVFDSDKCSEEITLTIGQAFDLAYKKFLDTNGRDLDLKNEYITLQKKVKSLEQENQTLKKRVEELEQLKDRDDIVQYKKSQQIIDLTVVTKQPGPAVANGHPTHVILSDSTLQEESSTDDSKNVTEADVTFSTGWESPRLEFVNGTTTKSSTTNGNSPSATGLISPPPPSTRPRTQGSVSSPTLPLSPAGYPDAVDAFGASSFNPQPASADPFGMAAFNPSSPTKFNPFTSDTLSVSSTERELLDIQAGFSQGLSFGTEDFNLADLDPLSQK